MSAAFIAASTAFAACNVSEQKKATISAILCGANARERDYHTEGPECVKRSAQKRFEDAAKVIAIFDACGDPAFSQKLQDANLETASFIQQMSSCSSEQIDALALFHDVQNQINAMAQSSLKCDAQLKTVIRDRRAYFESLLAQAINKKVREEIFSELAIRVDEHGNIVEK